MSNLQKRILVSAIYFPALLVAAYDHGWYFPMLMTLICGACWHEYLSFRFKPHNFYDWFWHFMMILVGVFPLFTMAFGRSYEVGAAVVALVLQVKVIHWIVQKRSIAEMTGELGFYVFGFIYLTGLFSLLTFIQVQSVDGTAAIWFLLFVVALTDTGAYFSGRFYGKTPFFQNVSPSKTQEGAWGGCLGALLIGVVFFFMLRHYEFPVPNLFLVILLSVVMAIASIFGDLFESLLKRTYGVKDSGKLLPGHGGVLDRFDGVIFAAIPLFFFMALRGGFR